MTNECATLNEYVATAPFEIRPLDYRLDKSEEERLDVLRSLGIRAQPSSDVKSARVIEAGYRPCPAERAVLLMEPDAESVDAIPAGISNSDGADIDRECGFWPGTSRASFAVGSHRVGTDFDFVTILRANHKPPPKRWLRRGDGPEPPTWYMLGSLRDLAEPIPYGVALRLKEVIDARVFDRVAVVARCDQFTSAAGGDPVILGGIAAPRAIKPGNPRPHDWFFVALWK